MSELKPCPFCGSEAKMYIFNNGLDWQVECLNDDCACGTTTWESKERAIEIWNTRIY